MRGELLVERLPATLGVTVAGVHLADLDESTWRDIEALFHEHALLVFPGQHLRDEEQRAFAERFGALEPGLMLTTISNLEADGAVRDAEGAVMQLIRGNEGWHTDSSYMPRAAKASMLSAHVVPSRGGETAWADMRAAYDALDATTQAKVHDLAAFHSIRYSQARAGLHNELGGAYGYDVDDPPLRPLVRIHPVTGRPALFIGRHAHRLVNTETRLADEHSTDEFLDELLAFATQPPRAYTHPWQPGDIAVWDNRCVLHRACAYDYSEPRVMKHSRIAGNDDDVATVLGYEGIAGAM